MPYRSVTDPLALPDPLPAAEPLTLPLALPDLRSVVVPLEPVELLVPVALPLAVPDPIAEPEPEALPPAAQPDNASATAAAMTPIDNSRVITFSFHGRNKRDIAKDQIVPIIPIAMSHSRHPLSPKYYVREGIVRQRRGLVGLRFRMQ